MTRSGLASVHYALASSTSIPVLAYAMIVIGHLDAVTGVVGKTRPGQAFIDITLTSLASVTRRTIASVATNFIHASSIVQTLGLSRISEAGTVVLIDLTEHSKGARRTRADIAPNQVNTGPSILTRMGLTLVCVNLTILSFKSGWALTNISTQVTMARASILTGVWVTLINGGFTVAASVARSAVTLVRGASSYTGSPRVTKLIYTNTFFTGCHFTRDTGHVTVNTCPSWRAITVERGPILCAPTAIFAGITLA